MEQNMDQDNEEQIFSEMDDAIKKLKIAIEPLEKLKSYYLSKWSESVDKRYNTEITLGTCNEIFAKYKEEEKKNNILSNGTLKAYEETRKSIKRLNKFLEKYAR